MRLNATIATAITGFALSGCASIATELPTIGAPALRAEIATQERLAMTQRAEDIERLVRVSRPIFKANAELCPKTRRDIGVTIHEEGDYPKELRLAARRELGTLSQPSVFRIAPDSPAEKAGLKVGDMILIDGKPVDSQDKTFEDMLEASSVELTIRRDGQIRVVTVKPDTLCRSRLRLKTSSVINAFANGRNITITGGMMEFARTDDELALIIGHELAHNTMGHIRKVIGNYVLSGFATRYTRPFESESDYVGLYYMVRAGYDPKGVEDFWRRLASVDPRSVNRAKTHPTFPDRYLRIAAARQEIEMKQAEGLPLVPNFKVGEDPMEDDDA